uniref:AAA+ ATPase domain-containing protein n=1 Tax=Auxenochlorella protothecoides TaxID=3075 RepID=A0A1D2AAW6_AUXPR
MPRHCSPFTSSSTAPSTARVWRRTSSPRPHLGMPSHFAGLQQALGRARYRRKHGGAPPQARRDEGDVSLYYTPPEQPKGPMIELPSQIKRREELSQDAPPLERYLAAAKEKLQAVYDRIYYGDVIPPVGAYRISYARMLELLSKKRVKRIIMMADGRLALIEASVENACSDYHTITYDRNDIRIMYAAELPEWKQEKNRFYCEVPGDIWEEGVFMRLIKQNQEERIWKDGKMYIPNSSILRMNEVRPELQIVDPSQANVFLSLYMGQFLPIAGLLALRALVGAGSRFFTSKKPVKKTDKEEQAEKYGAHRAREYNVPTTDGKGNPVKVRETGVRYSDVAGIDNIKTEIQEVIDILLGKEEYIAMGAKPFRGIMMEGPPGTGKTLLAKAMAGEGGMPFFSVNGAEFVEMFQGVAAARVRSLFRAARKCAPSIIFIDEIDAIGKARDASSDSGTQEREQGLLQLLAEMDGAVQADQVLVIGATNRIDQLDLALMRPGRFDRKVFMGLPSRPNRLKILKVHAEGKPVDRSNDDAALRAIADMTIGYSGAELANLLNEAAILSVRAASPVITLDTILEGKEKVELGLPRASLPDTPAKRRLAVTQAARAVALALTPGVPQMVEVSMAPRGQSTLRIAFEAQDIGRDGGTFLGLTARGRRTNAVVIEEEMSAFDVACGLLVPLYAARVAEEEIFGPDGASLSTGRELGLASELARWLVVDSTLHPDYRNTVLRSNMTLGGYPDPTTEWMDELHDDAILALQEAAHERAVLLVRQRRPVIEAVARELCDAADETVPAARILDLLTATPLAVPQRVTARQEEHRAVAARVLGERQLADDVVRGLAEVVMGRAEGWDFLQPRVVWEKAAAACEALADAETRARLAAMREFVVSGGAAPLPPPPSSPLLVPAGHGVGPQVPEDIFVR